MQEFVKTSAPTPDSARRLSPSRSIVAAAVAFLGAAVPSIGFAQVAPTSLPVQGAGWRYTASIYAYLPSVDGTSSFPADGQGTRLNVDGSKVLDKLKLFAMGTAGAHNGTWGVFTDVVYLKFQASESASRDFTIGNVGLPADASAAFDWEMKGTAWTLAGEYRVASAPSYTVDVLAGTRLLDTRQHLRWNIAGSIGPLDPAARSGEIQTSQSTWDAPSSASRVAMRSARIANGGCPSMSTWAPASRVTPCRPQPASATNSVGQRSRRCGATSATT